MVDKNIAKYIRQIELQTRRLLRGSLVGQSSSAVKGSGLEFDQIREYQQGDDVRFIDWKSSARLGTIMTRQYIDERSKTIVLAVDISGSTFFGSGEKTKRGVMNDVAAVLALVGERTKDHVALLLFSDEVELFIPPGKGRAHVRLLLERLFSYKPKRIKSSVTKALEHIARLSIRDVMVFIISDFICDSFQKALRAVAKKYEVIAVRCLDAHEKGLPSVGFLPMVDVETGTCTTIDARSNNALVQLFFKRRLDEQDRVFHASGAELIQVESGSPYIQNMVSFLKRRMVY